MAAVMSTALTLLLVDDDEAYLRLAKHFAERLGHTCLVAMNGGDAIELYRARQPDAVLMDILMPVMDGIEATAAILAEDFDAQVVFVSVLGEFPANTPPEIAESLRIRTKPASLDEMRLLLDTLHPCI